jgi:predicted secreted Zn-dependent protease
MRYLPCALVAVLTLVSFTLPAAESITTTYYRVGGATAGEVRADILRKGRKGWDGYTDWYLSWQFRWNHSGGHCAISSVTANLRATVILPQLDRRPDRAWENRWTSYLRALTRHEQDHVEIARRGAREVESAIRALAPAPSCGSLESSANAAGHAVVARVRRAQDQFDRDTEHGRTQGVIFP